MTLSVYSVFFSLGLSAVATFYFTDIGLHMQSIFLFWASASGGRVGLYIQTISSSFSFIGQHIKLILRKVFLLLGLLIGPFLIFAARSLVSPAAAAAALQLSDCDKYILYRF